MSRLRLLCLMCVLASVLDVDAAQREPSRGRTESPTATVRAWYLRFLGREPDRVGLRTWSESLREQSDERDVLAQILGGGEYFWRSGSTNEAFVTSLWFDLTGDQIDEEGLTQALRIVQAEGRERAARALIERAVVPNSAAEGVHQGEWREQVKRETDSLIASLDYLAEDVVVELSGKAERQVYGELESLMTELDRFRRLTRTSTNPDRLRDAFRETDQRLHAFVTDLRAKSGEHPAMLLRAQDLLRADRRLHAVVFAGDNRKQDSHRWLVRQTALLGDELHELRRTAIYALNDARASETLVRQLDELCADADHLVASIDAHADSDHLKRDVAVLSGRWGATVETINELPPQGHFFLRRRAQRVDSALDRLEETLQVDASRAHPYVR
jgi:hypothetical protein